MRIKDRVLLYCGNCGRIGIVYIIIPAGLLICELLIRIFSGGTALIYRAVGDTGIFPGAFLYMLSYVLRTVTAGLTAALLISDRCITKNRIKLILVSVIPCVLLLFEYKLIFVNIRLLTSLLLSAVCAASGVFLVLSLWQRGKKSIYVALLFTVLQTIFCIQTVSLLFHA